jgi:hypothetical protein
MSLLRCVSALVVGAFCFGQAHAQTSGVNPAEPIRIPRMTTSAPFIPFVATAKPAQAFEIPKVAHVTIQPSQVAQNDSACYALRSYGFTAHDLESNAPKPSSATTCTPRTAATMKGTGVSAMK